jgi:hypothetical protein
MPNARPYLMFVNVLERGYDRTGVLDAESLSEEEDKLVDIQVVFRISSFWTMILPY